MKTTLLLSALATLYVSVSATDKACNANYDECFALCGTNAPELTSDQCSHLCCVHENAIMEL